MRNRLWAGLQLDAPKRDHGSWAILFYRLGNHFALNICTSAKPGDFELCYTGGESIFRRQGGKVRTNSGCASRPKNCLTLRLALKLNITQLKRSVKSLVLS